MSFTERQFVRFRVGAANACVLIDALHAAPRSFKREFFTDEIAESVSSGTGCHCIIATVPREEADLNQWPGRENWEATQEYRETIGFLLSESEALDGKRQLRFPFLHLSLHGMRNRDSKDVELGTTFGESCSRWALHWLLDHFRNWAADLRNCRRTPKIVDNDPHDLLFGHPVITTHRCGDAYSKYDGYGPNYNTVQVELAHWLRTEHTDDLVELLSRIASEFPELAAAASGASPRM
jgi:hypothetical protein